MSTIKKENKEIYDGIKLNTESKERIIDELVEKIESNSGSNISELDRRRIEKMKRNERFVKMFKVGAVACFSLLASGLIIAGTIKYRDSNINKTAKETVSDMTEEIVSDKIKETANTETQETRDKNKADDEFWSKVEYVPDFELIKGPGSTEGGHVYEYEYSKCDIDGDGKKDTVNLKFSAGKDDSLLKDNTVIVSINGKETKKLEYAGLEGNDPRNCKMIKLSDGSYYVYFDVGNLTLLQYQVMFSLKDYKTVLDSSNLPYMGHLWNIVIDEENHRLYFFFWTQLNYVTGSNYQCYFEYDKNGINIKSDETNGYATVMDYRDKSADEDNTITENRDKYILKEDTEFYLDENLTSKKMTLKKGDKVYYLGARYNLNKRKKTLDKYSYNESYCYDLCSFVVEDKESANKIKVYLDPKEENESEIEIFEDTYWAQ